MLRVLREPFYDVRAVMDAQVVHAARPYRALVLIVAASVAAWWVYVPMHELLHAFGCWVTGGTVTELQIAPEYGGGLFAQFLPFVVAGGDYAGRLSGFDTHGSDLVYLATDIAPFLLTLFVGVPLLKTCAHGQRLLLSGAAFVVALAPFYSLTGDYYEMGSIITTRAITALSASETLRFAALRSDDVVKLITDVWNKPAEFQIEGAHGGVGAGLVIGGGLACGVVLAFATYAAGAAIARMLLRRSTSAR